MWVWSLGREDSLEKGMTTHSSILGEPHEQSRWNWRWARIHRVTKSQTQLKRLSMHVCIGEGNGNPLQYSCLGNPRDRGAWWASLYGVARSWTWLRRLITEFCQENIPVIANTFFQKHKRQLYTWTTPMVNTKIRLSVFSAVKDGESLYGEQKQDLGLTVTQIISSLL